MTPKKIVLEFCLGSPPSTTRLTTATGPDNMDTQVCYNYVGVFPAALTLVCTTNATGRYLFIQIMGTMKETLTLCEVVVYGDNGM